MRTRWELTPAALERLMARLDPDPAVAGAKYEHLRRALLKFFTWQGAPEPDTCADETLDRLARRLESGESIADVPSFAHGVARLVRLERVRRAAAMPTTFDATIAERLAAPEPEPSDRLIDDLQACLDALPKEDRALILRYYIGEGREKIEVRSRMAGELGISDSALRHRTQRLREQLKQCARRRQHGSENLDSTNGAYQQNRE